MLSDDVCVQLIDNIRVAVVCFTKFLFIVVSFGDILEVFLVGVDFNLPLGPLLL